MTAALPRPQAHAWLDWLVSPGWRWPRSVAVRLEHVPANAADLRALLPLSGAPRCLDLHLAGALVLARRHELPTKGRAQARSVLAYQLRLLSPSGRDEFMAGSRRLRSKAGLDTHLQVVARRRDVDAITQLARAEGLRVRRIVAEAEGSRIALLAGRSDADRDTRAWWTAGLLVALLGLAALTGQVWLEARQLRQAVLEATDALARLQGQADEVLRRREESGALNAAVAADAALFTQDADALARLADLTAALPAGAWLTHVTLEPARAYLAGSTSGDPADLVATFGSLAWVARVELAQPFLTDPSTGSTTFEFVLAAAAAPAP